MDYIIKDGELSHAGILGMKWGVRRYQNKDGTLTADGRKRYGVNPRTSRKKYTKEQLKDMEKSIKAKEKKSKTAKKTLEKARAAKQEKIDAAKKAKQEQEEFEAGKKKALQSGTATEILKYKGHLTNNELDTAIKRLDFETTLSNLSAKEVKTGFDKAEDFMNKVDRARKMTDKGIDAYNTTARIMNAFSDTSWPIIQDKQNASKKSESNSNNSKSNTDTNGSNNSKGKNSADKTEKQAKKGSSWIKKAADKFDRQYQDLAERNRQKTEVLDKEESARNNAKRSSSHAEAGDRYVKYLLDTGQIAGLLPPPRDDY